MNKKIICLLVLAFMFSSSVAQVAESVNALTLPWDSTGLAQEWNAFKEKFQKAYDSILKEIKAFQAWLQNRKAAQANQDSTLTYTEGENSLSDLSNEEFQNLLTLKIPKKAQNGVRGATDASDLPAAPASVDWRAAGKVTAVKQQGGCGSCWAFATIGALESLNMIKGNPQELYSEQHLVDCTNGQNCACSACNGGWPSGAMDWIAKNGITSSATCPYRGSFTGQNYCGSIRKSALQTFGAGTIAKGNTDELKRAVAIQPVVVCIDASNWFRYTGGIFNNCQANPNHAVLLVGYTDQYWLIKNSWGSGWGEQGYIRLARGNTCGIADYAAFPLRDANVKDFDNRCYQWKGYCTTNDYVKQNCRATCRS